MRFREAELEKTYTVTRVRDRKTAAALERRGIAPGSDIVILSRPAEGALVRLVNGRESSLTEEEAASLTLEEPRLRKASDPVFLGGCCAYGNTAEVWDKYVNGDAPSDA